MKNFYSNVISNVPVGVDETDHMGFFCPKCDVTMIVTGVETQHLVMKEKDLSSRDNCTWVRLRCPKCAEQGKRKFYWWADGTFLTERTDG